MKLNCSVYTLLLLCFTICAAEYSPLIEINQGKLRGITKTDWKGGKFYSFLSVPYAKKPIGKLRFIVPAPAEKWDAVFDAVEDMPICIQKTWFNEYIGQEDCLYLNIHTPEIDTKSLKPVMVFIHGGGYTEGDGRADSYGPEFLVSEGVLLVTINYRLGLFGFLNFENPNVGVSGNMGLKDQNLALKWIQKNIEKFGGDPKSVTIFGDSAGGASVHMHMLSPMSQGLFHKVIAHSGTGLCPWNNIGKRNTGVQYAKELGFEGTSEMKMLSFLQDAPTESIFKAIEHLNMLVPIHEEFLAGPIHEINNNESSFLPNSLDELLAAHNYEDVPFMLGFTDAEAIIFDVISLINTDKVAEMPLERTLMRSLNIKDEVTKKEIIKEIENFYYKGQKTLDQESKLDLLGDAWNYWGISKTARTHAQLQHKNVYMYLFSINSKLNYFKRLHPVSAKLHGASHMDDLGYIFKNKHTPTVKPDSLEAKSIEKVVKLWTNFAKYGNPTPDGSMGVKWEPVQEDTLNYLHIAAKSMKMHKNPYARRVEFWDKLHRGERQFKENTPIHTEL